MAARNARVLVVEDDPSLGDLLHAVLVDEGYTVSLLSTSAPDAVRFAVARLEPDCVVLDGYGVGNQGRTWADAEWVAHRARAVPVVLMSADGELVKEATENASERSRAARLAEIVPKPFDLDVLLAAVRRAAGTAAPFDASHEAEARRTEALVAKLKAGGAVDVSTSTRREWANFYTRDGALAMLYWSERDAVYYVLRQAAEGGSMRQIGRFYDLDAAITLALGSPSASDQPDR